MDSMNMLYTVPWGVSHCLSTIRLYLLFYSSPLAVKSHLASISLLKGVKVRRSFRVGSLVAYSVDIHDTEYVQLPFSLCSPIKPFIFCNVVPWMPSG